MIAAPSVASPDASAACSARACVLLAAYPGIAAAAPAAPTLDKLTLTSVCTLPDGDAVFRVGNSNALAVTYTWDINKTSFAGKGVAPVG